MKRYKSLFNESKGLEVDIEKRIKAYDNAVDKLIDSIEITDNSILFNLNSIQSDTINYITYICTKFLMKDYDLNINKMGIKSRYYVKVPFKR